MEFFRSVDPAGRAPARSLQRTARARLAVISLRALVVGRLFAGALVVSVLASGCREGMRSAGETAPETIAPIYTTFYPVSYLTRRIVGDLVPVVCPLPPGQDPIFWTPPAETIAAYQAASLIVTNGAGFEQWVDRVSLPSSRIVRSARPIDPLRYEHSVLHIHGPAGEHTHEGIDGHTWLDPENARLQAGEILAAVSRRFPAHREAFEAAHAALDADLRALAGEFEALSVDLSGTPLFASHPAYNYLVRRFGWKLLSLDLDPERAPDVQELDGIRELQREHPARILLWESEPSRPAIEALSAIGLESVVFSPCESLDPGAESRGEDYLAIQRANLDRLRAASPAR